MNTKRSHKIFSLVMLILIISTVVATATISIYKIYEYKHQLKLQEDIKKVMDSTSSEVSSEK